MALSARPAARGWLAAGAVAAVLAGSWFVAEGLRHPGPHPLHGALGWLCRPPGPAPATPEGLWAVALVGAGSSALAVIPCLVQMATVLTAIWCGTTPAMLASLRPEERLRRAGAAVFSFLAGCLLVWLPGLGLLVAAHRWLVWWGPPVRAFGGAVLLAVALRQLASWWLTERRSAARRPKRPGSTVDDETQRGQHAESCIRPAISFFHRFVHRGGFFRRRRAEGRLGFSAAAGAAYAAYCVSCCGPWLAAAGLAAASTARPGAAAAAWALHSIVAALPVLVMLAAPRPLTWLSRLGRRVPHLPLASGGALTLIGLWLAGSAALL